MCTLCSLNSIFPSYSCCSSFLAHYTPYIASFFPVSLSLLPLYTSFKPPFLPISFVFLLSFSTTPVPCFLWMVHFSLHPFSIHPNDLVSLQAELLLLDGTSAQWRHTPLSPPALSVYGVSPFVVSHLPIAQ